MAKLVWKSSPTGIREFPLQEGLNRIGRAPENEIVIEGSTVSLAHCELWLMRERLLLRDLESTNGTYVDGHTVTEVELRPGSVVGIGEAQLMVEDLPAAVRVPAVAPPPPPPPRFTPEGLPCCARHSEELAAYRCSQCGEQFCSACAQVLARRGGRRHAYCPVCHGECVSIIPPRLAPAQAKPGRVPEGWLGRWAHTLRMRR